MRCDGILSYHFIRPAFPALQQVRAAVSLNFSTCVNIDGQTETWRHRL
jgi:hypothetical protein